ncbi:hypothetical protein BJ912DRAFT_390481 [Pholiota molesta]|nr:hypothetical protein BJ912DRAFT_390481 [Pholiota molesta]
MIFAARNMFKLMVAILGMSLPGIFALDEVLEEPIYVPFAWDQVPQNASIIGTQGSSTTYALTDGATSSPTLGPATTLVQSGSAASMYYVKGVLGAQTPTLSGVCNLASPVAVCTLNVYTTGAALPGGGTFGSLSGEPGSASSERYASGSSGGSIGTSWAGCGASIVTVVLGFCTGIALVKLI